MAEMHLNTPSCITLGVMIFCRACSSDNVIKNGKSSNDKQRYLCKNCGKRFIVFTAIRPIKRALRIKLRN
ncbi:MAG: IS1 family transposase [Chitinophagaceae bacterium]|nr:IS1 family transposase [Chitinophagaceae bacterium]